MKEHNELCEQLFRSGVRRSTHLEPGTYQKCGSKDSDIVTYVDGRKETDEMRVEAVDISDGLTAVPAVGQPRGGGREEGRSRRYI
jgi:hypothetical protein